MRINPDNDPNETYEVRKPPIPGPPQEWFGIYCNGVYIGSNAPAPEPKPKLMPV